MPEFIRVYNLFLVFILVKTIPDHESRYDYVTVDKIKLKQKYTHYLSTYAHKRANVVQM
jgi:hypothetical protein